MTRCAVLIAVALLAAGLVAGCDLTPEPTALSQQDSASGAERAVRRAYHGAPPTISHPPLGASCTSCHTADGSAAPPVGMAPANPHLSDPRIGAAANCRQCHVFVVAASQFLESSFVGSSSEMRRGSRLYAGAPPTIPHSLAMRQACAACHAGPAARPEIRCTHPERTNCRQCHLEVHRDAN